MQRTQEERMILKKLRDHLGTIHRQLRHPYGTRRKFLNYLVSYVEARAGIASGSLAKPYTCYVDVSSACNLRCPLCPTGMRRKGARPAMMPMETFERVLHELGPFIYDMHLYNWGESLLNPHIAEMAALAHGRGIATHISTNGNHMPPGLARDLVESGLDRLVFSIDGASQETYQHYRAGGNLQRVLTNVRSVLDARRGAGRRTPRVVWQFLTMRHNQHEIGDVKRRAREIGVDEVSFEWFRTNVYEELLTPVETLVEKYRDWIPTLEAFTKFDVEQRATRMGAGRCLQPWYRVVIGPTGDVYPCCSIYDDKFRFGNILETPLATLWNGPAFRAARIEQGRFARTAATKVVCGVCQVFPKKNR